MRQYDETEKKKMEQMAEEYRKFLDAGKTERECAARICSVAEEYGYRNLDTILENGETLKPGDKIYAVNMKKAVLMMNIGEEPLEKGMNLIGSHIDSPRLDIKQNPVYENSGLAYLDTHYYGGIKKYQWVASPMAIHGTIVKADGTQLEICIGETDGDPVVGVTDLLVHLSGKQQERKASEVIEGESLDILAGSCPVEDDQEKEPVKAYLLNLLKETYGIEERDFISAELEVVPAGKAREFGLDRSMLMAYGQDDRICAFTSLMALLDAENVSRTNVCLFVDKEEIGSVGATGMHSYFLENTLAEVLNCLGQYSELALRRSLKNSQMLSADVNAGYDPLYADAFEKNNAAYVGKGAVISKYTGSRGKSGSNDANAEFIGKLRQAFERDEIHYQTAELGKIDVGGGGTIAFITAAYGMEVIDLGVPILNMHAPYEVSSKADVYETYRCYRTFYQMSK